MFMYIYVYIYMPKHLTNQWHCVRCYMLFSSFKMSGRKAVVEVVGGLAVAVAELVMQAGLGGLKWRVEGSLSIRSKMNVIEIFFL